MGRGLRVGEATTLGLQFKSVELAAMNNQKIGNAGDGAEGFKNGGLNWRSPTTGGIVENKKILHAAPVQVIEHGALQLRFRRATAVTGAHDGPRSRRRKRSFWLVSLLRTAGRWFKSVTFKFLLPPANRGHFFILIAENGVHAAAAFAFGNRPAFGRGPPTFEGDHGASLAAIHRVSASSVIQILPPTRSTSGPMPLAHSP